MRILGIGVDIILNNRIKRLIKNKDFIKRTFGKKEIETSRKIYNRVNFFAKRFAAKEATWKALNPLRGDGLFFKEIEVLNDLNGKPFLLFTGKTKIYIQKKEKTLNSKLKFDISISDEPPFIIAFVVISLAPNA